MEPRRAAAAVLAAIVGAGCAGAAEPAAMPATPTLAQWRWARQRLATLRGDVAGRGLRTMRIALALREPYTGRTLEARGAVAIAPPDALRMILVGPGGTTALDLWVRGESFRFSVPAIGLLRRGDARTPRASMRGLPVDFLRWWMLRPMGGSLLWYDHDGVTDRFLLRDAGAIVRVSVTDRDGITARRTTPPGGAASPDEESVVADRLGCGPVRYRQASTGLTIAVTCEGEETARAPDPRAFADPDAAEAAP